VPDALSAVDAAPLMCAGGTIQISGQHVK
jgi:hypothetical protein